MKDPVQAVAQFHERTEPPPQIPMDHGALVPAVLLLVTIAFGLGLVVLLGGAP